MKLYWHYFSIRLRSAMQYKSSLIMMTVGQFMVSFNTFLGMFFLFESFSGLKDFTFSEVLFCYAIVLMQFSLAEFFGRGFDAFSGMVSNGEFDRVLVRPANLIVQVLGSKIAFTRIGRIIQALLMFAYAITQSAVQWDFARIFTLLLMIFCGSLLFFGLFVIYASFCFFTIEGLEFMNIFTDGAREYGKYPISIYGKKVLRFCTYVIPLALVQYYPYLYLIGRNNDSRCMLLPLAATLFLIPCLLFWQFGVRHYQSSGS